MSDVRSISSIRDEQETNKNFLCLSILWTRITNKDPDTIDLIVPRRTQYLHKTWKTHPIQNSLTFYHTQSNANILQETLPAFRTLNIVTIENWRKHVRIRYMLPWPPPKISLTHGFRSCSATNTKLLDKQNAPNPTQPNPNPNHGRTGQPHSVVTARTPIQNKQIIKER